MNNKSSSPPPLQGGKKGGITSTENKKDETTDNEEGSPGQNTSANGIGWSEEIRRRANIALGKQKVNLKNAFQPNNTIANTGN